MKASPPLIERERNLERMAVFSSRHRWKELAGALLIAIGLCGLVAFGYFMSLRW